MTHLAAAGRPPAPGTVAQWIGTVLARDVLLSLPLDVQAQPAPDAVLPGVRVWPRLQPAPETVGAVADGGCALSAWTTSHGALIAGDATVIQVDANPGALGVHHRIDRRQSHPGHAGLVAGGSVSGQ